MAEMRAEIQRGRAGVYESRRRRRGRQVLIALALPALLQVVDLARVIAGYSPAFLETRPFLLAFFLLGMGYAFGFHFGPRRLWASSFDFALAGAYMVAWYAPSLVGLSRLGYFVWLVPVEIVAIACAFAVEIFWSMETLVHRIQIATGALFIVGTSVAIAYQVGHWWPFLAVAVLGTNEAMFPARKRKRSSAAYPGWIARLGMFVLLSAILWFWEMPRYGWANLDPALLQEQLQGFPTDLSRYVTVAFGFFYFFGSGLYEITGRSE